MELTQGSETSANYNLTPGKYPKEYIQYSNHGESLKSRILYCKFKMPRCQKKLVYRRDSNCSSPMKQGCSVSILTYYGANEKVQFSTGSTISRLYLRTSQLSRTLVFQQLFLYFVCLFMSFILLIFTETNPKIYLKF